MKQSITLLALLAIGLAACGGGGAPSIAAPPNGGNFVSYFGTSSSDIWAFRPASSASQPVFSHWDGSSWAELGAAGPMLNMTTACSAGPGKAWMAGANGFGRVDALGMLEDFSAEVPNAPSLDRAVYCGGGIAFAEVVGNKNDPTSPAAQDHAYVFDGAHFKEIPVPDGVVGTAVGPATLWSDKNIYMTVGDTNTALQSTNYPVDAGTDEFHFDGVAWTRGTANRLGSGLNVPTVTGSSSLFPANDVWLRCGKEPLQFDGTVLRPLAAPLPATASCWFGYSSGHPIILFGATASPAVIPTAYAYDDYGNATLLDVAGSVDLEFHRMDWDGHAWTGDQAIATVKACVGPACGYNGGPQRYGVFGELSDGTQLFEGPASEGGAVSLWLVK